MLNSDFIVHFSNLEDPRVENHNTRHDFLDILVLAFVANLCGCDDWQEVEEFCNVKIDFFQQFLKLEYGIPSHQTFRRVFAVIDSFHFEELLVTWMKKIFNKTKGEVIAIDGKTVCGARYKDEAKGMHLVQAWACENKLTLGVTKVNKKTNEITAIKKILGMLNILNCTITIDAIGCQKDIAEKIIKNKGDYVLCVKNNQKMLRNEIEFAFSLHEKEVSQNYMNSTIEVDKGHGRTEYREYQTLPADYCKSLISGWVGIKSIIKVIRQRTINEVTTEQINYYISSHSSISGQISKAIRKHWNIENCLHWQLDVSFNEDNCRSRVKNEAENLAIMRRLSLSLLKKTETKKKRSIKVKRKKASWDEGFLLGMLTSRQF